MPYFEIIFHTLCMSQTRTGIFINVCRILFVVNDLRWEVVARLVDFG